jgi:hypothetical protein
LRRREVDDLTGAAERGNAVDTVRDEIADEPFEDRFINRAVRIDG